MPERVNRDGLAELQLAHHPPQGPLDARPLHRAVGQGGLMVIASVAGNSQTGWRCVTQYSRSIFSVLEGNGT